MIITVQDTTFKVARRDGQPALTADGQHVLIFSLCDRRVTAHLPIDQLPF